MLVQLWGLSVKADEKRPSEGAHYGNILQFDCGLAICTKTFNAPEFILI